MALPTPPPYTTPIPNNSFYSDPAYIAKGAYYPLTMGSGLSVDPVTAILTSSGGGGGVSGVFAGSGISVNANTGNVTITNTGVTDVTAGAGISISGASGSVIISSTNFGTVTSITAGTGLTGGVITVGGTLALAPSGVNANVYTNPTLTIDTYGRVTLASSNPAVSNISVTAPITISGTTTPTIGILPATTSQSGAVQLSDAVNDAASVCAASTAAVKTAYDLAAAAIPCSVIAAKGTLITGNGTPTVTALPVGVDGQVLTACAACATGLTWESAVAVPSATPTAEGIVFACTIAGISALGLGNLTSNAGGNAIVAIGGSSLNSVATAIGSTAVGENSLSLATDSIDDVAIGVSALPTAVVSCFNVAVGGYAGDGFSNGCCNVFLGYCVASSAANVDGELAIGNPGGAWLRGNSTYAITPGAGIIDCTASCGTANMVLTSQGNAVEWKFVSSAMAAPNYGSFLNTGTQVITTVGTPQPVEIPTVVDTNNFTIVNNSEITAAVAGTYNLQFSLQLVVTTGGGGIVEIWLAKNGVAVPNSNTQFSVKNVNEAEFAALNYIKTLAAGDNLQLIWVTDDVHIQLISYAAGANFVGAPAVPSAIVTIVPVGA